MAQPLRYVIALIVAVLLMALPVFADETSGEDSSAPQALFCNTFRDCDQTEYDEYDKVSFTYDFLHFDLEPGYCWYRVEEYEYSCVEECERCRWCTKCRNPLPWVPDVTSCNSYGRETCSESCDLNGTEVTIQRLRCR